MAQQIVHDLIEFEHALRLPRMLLFKHSTACPISAAAHEEYLAFCAAHPDASTVLVDVIADRATARGIAERCGVRHESPQAILFENGRAAWHASHMAITAAALANAWAPRR
jgi:bacillithiol system protein YtxJ